MNRKAKTRPVSQTRSMELKFWGEKPEARRGRKEKSENFQSNGFRRFNRKLDTSFKFGWKISGTPASALRFRNFDSTEFLLRHRPSFLSRRIYFVIL